MREYHSFSFEGANFRICSTHFGQIVKEIKSLRVILSNYIEKQPAFLEALNPINIQANAPLIVQRMAAAAEKTGVGPMASVAGITAQLAAEKAVALGASEAIVENGGDTYLLSGNAMTIGIYAKNHPLSGKIAFSIPANTLPIAVCSSSSKMGHSLSFGNCELVSVFSKDAALADAAATAICNKIQGIEDVNPQIELFLKIHGISGILVLKDGQIGMGGDLPEIVKLDDQNLGMKITRDKNSPHTVCL